MVFKDLGVCEHLSFDIVKRNYRRLILAYHLNKNPSEDGKFFIAIRKAFYYIENLHNNNSYPVKMVHNLEAERED